jgi:hypothetical protein
VLLEASVAKMPMALERVVLQAPVPHALLQLPALLDRVVSVECVYFVSQTTIVEQENGVIYLWAPRYAVLQVATIPRWKVRLLHVKVTPSSSREASDISGHPALMQRLELRNQLLATVYSSIRFRMLATLGKISDQQITDCLCVELIDSIWDILELRYL